METKTSSQRMNQSSYKLNLLQAKAQNYIRRHQIKEFINAGSGSSDIKITQNDQNSQLSQHLLHLKTSCSGVKVDIKNKELQLLKYKDQTNFIAEKAKVIQAERYQLQNQIQKLKTVVEEVKSKKLNASLGSKSYEHILERMKKDEIKYQIRRNELQKDLKGLQKTYKQLHDKGYQLKQYQFMSVSGLKEAQGQIKELNHNRKTTLADMNSIVEEKSILQRKKQERKDKSDIIKQMAAGDLQDADLIRMKKFLTAQVFLQAVLRSKIQKLKSFYEPYELAFLKIKGNTNVRDANTLKAEYHNFEVSYSQKSSWVKHLEEEIAIEEQEKQQLQKQYSAIQEKELQIQQEMEKLQAHQQNPYKKQLQLKSQKCQITMMAVREWLQLQSKRIGVELYNGSESLMLKQICLRLKQHKDDHKLQ